MTPWTLDPAHSTIGFSVRHMMVSKVRGSFRRFTLDVTFDPEHPDIELVQAAPLDVGTPVLAAASA